MSSSPDGAYEHSLVEGDSEVKMDEEALGGTQNSFQGGNRSQNGASDLNLTAEMSKVDEVAPVDGFVAWLNVLGSFMCHFIVLGNVYAFSIFVKPYEERFPGEGRAKIVIIYQLQLAMLMGGGFFAGPLADSLGVRPVFLTGVVLYALGYFTASFSPSLGITILTQGALVGLANAALYWPAVTILPQWFVKRRALALGLAVLGSGIGNLVQGILASSLIESNGIDFGLRILALEALVLLAIASILLKRRLPVTGTRRLCGDPRILKDRNYQLMIVGAMFFQLPYNIPFASLAPFVEDKGFPTSFAALAVGMIGVGSAIGRVFLGLIADHVGRVRTFQFCIAGTAVFLWMWLGASSSEGLVIFFTVGFGFFSGGFIALVPAVMSAFYGVANMGKVMSFVSLSLIPGSFLGPYVAGEIFDQTGEYELAIILSGAIATFSAIVYALLDINAKEVDYFSESNTDEGQEEDAEAEASTSDSKAKIAKV